MTIIDQLICEPEAVYTARRINHLTSHALADFRTCPLLYRHKQIGLTPEVDSTAFLVGRATHVLALEGRSAYEVAFTVGGPINEKTGRPFGRDTKAFAEWAAACARPVLSLDQAELVEALADSVLRHPVAALLLCDGVAERVARLSYAGMPCQARLDWIAPEHGIVDLKTCDDLTWFENDARRFNYAHQMAFYRALLREACGETVPVHLIAVEKHAPYRCGVWRISDQVLDGAERENLAAMRSLEHCQRTDVWPTGYEDIRTFDYL